MPGLSLQTRAFVVLKRPPSDAFQALSLFSEDHGSLSAMQRIARRAAPTLAPLDLFDEAELGLESPSQGRTWFVKDARLIVRHDAIGRSYDRLRFASRLSAVVARNPVHEESRRTVAELLRTALSAFDREERPDIVYFKGLYRFARDEGYPVKQEWLQSLGEPLGTLVSGLLNRPVGEAAAAASEVEAMIRRLELYLRGHTEILLD